MGKRMRKPMMGDECPRCGETRTNAVESADSRCVKIRWFRFTCKSCGAEIKVGPFRKIDGLDYELLMSEEEIEKAIQYENSMRATKGLDTPKSSEGCLSGILFLTLFVLSWFVVL